MLGFIITLHIIQISSHVQHSRVWTGDYSIVSKQSRTHTHTHTLSHTYIHTVNDERTTITHDETRDTITHDEHTPSTQ